MVDSEERELRTRVATACRIIAMDGYADFTLGHVSARRKNPELIYIKRMGVGLDEATPEDIITVDLDGAKVEGEGEPHKEVPLHTEIYKARPDVGAIAHSHPPYATSLASSSGRLEMVNHDAALFKDGLPRFDRTPGLIVSAVEAREVAEALGAARAVLMRNHGVMVVGANLPWLAYTALSLERAVRIQYIAGNLGSVLPMSETEKEKLFPSKFPEELIEEYWSYLVRRLERLERATGAAAAEAAWNTTSRAG